MKKLIVIMAVIAVASLLLAATAWTDTQSKAHRIADLAREIGLEEDNAIIREAQFLWWAETDGARILAKVLVGECLNCTDRHQQLTAMTVLNRMASPEFPDTVKEVVAQEGQYLREYTRNLTSYADGDEMVRRCYRNAYAAFMGQTECPPNVIYASEFPPSVLGSGCYEVSKTYVNGVLFSTTYFNYR